MNQRTNRETRVIDLGLIDYKKAWDYQSNLFDSILRVKSQNRELPQSEQKPTENYLLFCEHPHVFTLGKSGDEKNLLIPKEKLSAVSASYYPINRGGDITYHGPGQIVSYPILDLENFFTDIHRYMRTLEEAVIQTLSHFSIAAGRIKGLTGVWIGHDSPTPRKICALGVKTSRWVTLHGLAFNVNTNLKYFKYIVPCGIADKEVTSMEHELGKPANFEEVKAVLESKLISLFGMTEAMETHRNDQRHQTT